MLVRCERVIGPMGPVSDSEWLTVGNTYHVLEMLILPGRETQVRILDDTNSSGLWALSMFTQVTKSVPGNWTVHMLGDGAIEFAPARWCEPGFWESYFDGDPAAETVFAEELALIRASDPVGEGVTSNLHATVSRHNYPVPISGRQLWQLLHAADDPNHLEHPADYNHRQARERFEQLVRRLDVGFGCQSAIDRDTQDASMHGRITVPAAATAGSRTLVVVVSNFADLVVLAVDNPGTWTAAETARLLHADDADRIYAALGDLDYVLIPEEPLWQPYDGACDPAIFAPTEATWWTRYFDYV